MMRLPEPKPPAFERDGIIFRDEADYQEYAEDVRRMLMESALQVARDPKQFDQAAEALLNPKPAPATKLGRLRQRLSAILRGPA